MELSTSSGSASRFVPESLTSLLRHLPLSSLQIPKLSDLKQLDKNAYDYFYHQVRCDVLHNAIPEIAYPKFKNDILGLCVTDMFVEMLEHNRSVDYLNDNYKKYIPKELAKHHSLFARKEIKASLKSIKNKEHDVL